MLTSFPCLLVVLQIMKKGMQRPQIDKNVIWIRQARRVERPTLSTGITHPLWGKETSYNLFAYLCHYPDF